MEYIYKHANRNHPSEPPRSLERLGFLHTQDKSVWKQEKYQPSEGLHLRKMKSHCSSEAWCVLNTKYAGKETGLQTFLDSHFTPVLFQPAPYYKAFQHPLKCFPFALERSPGQDKIPAVPAVGLN